MIRVRVAPVKNISIAAANNRMYRLIWLGIFMSNSYAVII